MVKKRWQDDIELDERRVCQPRFGEGEIVKARSPWKTQYRTNDPLGRPKSERTTTIGRPKSERTATLGRPKSERTTTLGRPKSERTTTLGRPKSERTPHLEDPSQNERPHLEDQVRTTGITSVEVPRRRSKNNYPEQEGFYRDVSHEGG